ncbi:MAG: hypothetical protein QOH90_95 [Actinomycetota bacterium]|jgi:hypothetical protein|nr:hypothetical protein [Actinomycetota bacterium]
MSNYFSTEIGRIRSEEMVARGLRYQAVAAQQRSKDRDSCLTVPRQSHRTSVRRVLVTAVLSLLFMVLVSSAALAYPVDGGSSVSRAVVGGSSGSVQHVTTSAGFDPLWLVAMAVAVVLAAGSAFLLNHRHAAATA